MTKTLEIPTNITLDIINNSINIAQPCYITNHTIRELGCQDIRCDDCLFRSTNKKYITGEASDSIMLVREIIDD